MRYYLFAFITFLLVGTVAHSQQLDLRANPSATGTAATGQIPGTATNDNAAAGKVGEYVSATLSYASGITLTNVTAANVVSISLTAGDWDIRGDAAFTGTGSPSTLVQTAIGLSTTSATLNGSTVGMTNYAYVGVSGVNIGTSTHSATIGPVRFSLSTTTTVYLVVRASFTDNAPKAAGLIEARRVR